MYEYVRCRAVETGSDTLTGKDSVLWGFSDSLEPGNEGYIGDRVGAICIKFNLPLGSAVTSRAKPNEHRNCFYVRSVDNTSEEPKVPWDVLLFYILGRSDDVKVRDRAKVFEMVLKGVQYRLFFQSRHRIQDAFFEHLTENLARVKYNSGSSWRPTVPQSDLTRLWVNGKTGRTLR